MNYKKFYIWLGFVVFLASNLSCNKYLADVINSRDGEDLIYPRVTAFLNKFDSQIDRNTLSQSGFALTKKYFTDRFDSDADFEDTRWLKEDGSNWIKDCYAGWTERQIKRFLTGRIAIDRNKLRNAKNFGPNLRTVKFAELKESYNKIDNSVSKKNIEQTVYIVQGLSVEDLPYAYFSTALEDEKIAGKSLFENTLGQGASQFNWIELKNDFLNEGFIAYPGDTTQGPLVCKNAGLCTMLRLAMCEKGMLPHALQDVLPAELLNKQIEPELWENLDKISLMTGLSVYPSYYKDIAKILPKNAAEAKELFDRNLSDDEIKYPNLIPTYYRNGYFHLGRINQGDAQVILDSLKANIDQLNLLFQWVKSDVTGQNHLQIFSSAVSFQGNKSRKYLSSNPVYIEICGTVLEAQYSAIGMLASSRAIKQGSTQLANYTRVGGGAFCNHTNALNMAYAGVKRVTEGYDVVNLFHAYSDRDVNDTRVSLIAAGFNPENIRVIKMSQLEIRR